VVALLPFLTFRNKIAYSEGEGAEFKLLEIILPMKISGPRRDEKIGNELTQTGTTCVYRSPGTVTLDKSGNVNLRRA
jgi:hypothetical protein